jgi:hypothetical protein
MISAFRMLESSRVSAPYVGGSQIAQRRFRFSFSHTPPMKNGRVGEKRLLPKRKL